MTDQKKKALEIENLEVNELEDEGLEDVAGGGTNTTCTEINNVAGCGAPAPKLSEPVS